MHQVEFFYALAKEDKWVLDAYDHEFEAVFEPLVTEFVDLVQKLVAINKAHDVAVVVIS